MPVAEIVAEAAARARTHVVGRIHQDIEVARMRRHRVVAVDAVLGQQLPVGADRVFLAAADDRHAGVGLVADHVEIFLGVAEVIRQRNDVRIEGDEIEVAVAFIARHGLHVRGIAALEVLGDRTLRRAGCAACRPRRIPSRDRSTGTIWRCPCVSRQTCAPRCGQVFSSASKLPLGVARKENASAADRAGDEIARLRQFRGVSEIQPGPVEDLFLLRLVDFMIDKVAARDLEYPLRRIHEKGRLSVFCVHGVSFL